MGLGETIQAIGVAELLSRMADIHRVLIVCPASLKSQWRSEINRFSDRSTQIVMGTVEQRSAQYSNDTFFTICNFEQGRPQLKITLTDQSALRSLAETLAKLLQ